MSKVRVLIVDDSPTIRVLIRSALQQDGGIEVVGEAGDPLEARELIKAAAPDVITLDVEMPKMSGIEFLEKIMRLRPMPVIMCSTLTQSGASITIEALEMGAFDCVGKPHFEELADKVKAAARARIRPMSERTAAPPRRDSGYRPSSKILAIGSSTGGVEALCTVLAGFPENCPATVITQHMPPTFTTSFAARLDRMCAPKVQEASEGAPILPGHIYIAPGGDNHLVIKDGLQARCSLVAGPPMSGHRPSVDMLFNSVVKTFGPRAVGMILTGMGRDGAAGLKAMRDIGAKTLGQNEATCVVYGMPKVAFEMGAVERQLPLNGLCDAALDLCAASMRKIA
jgi:two-component system, chemotaxis family, protein-glutamate methylesterase/glutaminase